MRTYLAMTGLLPVFFTTGRILASQPTLAQTDAPKDAPLPPLPAACRPLPLVGGEGSEVTKTASVPGLRVPLPGLAPSIGVCNKSKPRRVWICNRFKSIPTLVGYNPLGPAIRWPWLAAFEQR